VLKLCSALNLFAEEYADCSGIDCMMIDFRLMFSSARELIA